MKQRQILIRVFLAILCLPLSACLFGVKGTSTSGVAVKYPINGNGVVDLTSVTDIESLRLAGYNLFQSGNPYVSLQCKDNGGVFTELYGSSTTKSFYLTTPSDFWSSVAAICDHQVVGNNDSIELALKLGDNYAPIITKDNVTCVGMALLIERKQLTPAITGCIASDPRGTGTGSYSAYGFNSDVEGINVLTLLLPQ
jgi:hypothetical protein